MFSHFLINIQAAERAANTLFDGVLPPFSNVGNTVRGEISDTPTLRGIGTCFRVMSDCLDAM